MYLYWLSTLVFFYRVGFFPIFKFTRKTAKQAHHVCAGNVLMRCQSEMEGEKNLLDLANRKARGDAIKMSGEQIKAVQRLQIIVRALHTSLLSLDDMLLTMSF